MPAVTVLLASLALLARPGTAETPAAVLEGSITADGPAYVMLPFEVPAGVEEVEVRHRSLDDGNILDFGVHDPAGFRGYGGGNREPAIIGRLAASRSYLPGAIPAGQWQVTVGKAQLKTLPARYRVEIFLRSQPTLAPQPQRRPYEHAPALEIGRRWYAGDFHVHSRESGDAQAGIDQIATFARERGLDFVALSDHNTVSHLELIPDAQGRHPNLLLMPAVEYTTYQGHANAFGISGWVDHRLGIDGLTIEQVARAYADQGAIFSINHPALDLGDLCIGCAWHHDLPGELLGGVEIATGDGRVHGHVFTREAIAMWDALSDQGHRIPAIGGSDDHRGGEVSDFLHSPIGTPTTMVLSRELSVPALLEALKEGRTVVKLQGPSDPMVEINAGEATIGDLVRADGVTIDVVVTGGEGGELQLVHEGVPLDPVEIDADPFRYRFEARPASRRPERWRAEVSLGGAPRTVTSHLWVAAPEAGEVGCACRATAPLVLPLPLLALLLLRRRERRA